MLVSQQPQKKVTLSIIGDYEEPNYRIVARYVAKVYVDVNEDRENMVRDVEVLGVIVVAICHMEIGILYILDMKTVYVTVVNSVKICIYGR